jgi:predicted aspartyl protease
VNGGPEVDLLLDTGGAELILDESFARSGGIPVFGGERSVFGGGKTATLTHAAVGSLALGDLTIRNLPAHVIDLGQIGSMLGVASLSGIVGTSLLYRFLATIDYPAEALVLRPRGASSPASAAIIDVPMLMADDHFLLAEGRLNDGPPTMLFVDSGLAGGAFACPASTLKEAGIERGSTQIVKGRGGGGEMTAWPFDVSALSLGQARREGLQGIAGAFPPQLEWAYGFRIGGLVSHGFLRAYAVTFDFDRMIIRLDPSQP